MGDTQNQENPPEFEREQPRRIGTPRREDTDHGAGVSNRPLEEEEANQERLPPRGEEKKA